MPSISRIFRLVSTPGLTGFARAALLCIMLSCLAGCTPFDTRKAVEPLLKQPKMSPDTVVFDVFVVRFPFGDPAINEAAWREVDEQRLPIEDRRRFMPNGFRAGVLAGPLPVELSRLITSDRKQSLPGEMTRLTAQDLTKEPTVMQGHFQLRAGARKELVVAKSKTDLPVMIRDADGNVSGQSYADAQLLFAVSAYPMGDGRVRLELVPEVLHGQYSQRWSTNAQGVIRWNPSRETRAFEDMKLETVLSAGHMLILSTMPSKPGSLGHHFFSEPSGNQKLIIVRLSQTQHDGEFARPANLVIE